jgi:uncharacterized protein (DUF1919 family)
MIGRLWLLWKQRQVERAKQKIFRERRTKLLRTDFAIVANNCWGGEFYKYFDLPFNSPFLGLFLYPDCFIQLLENWDKVDLQKISIGHNSIYKKEPLSYPVGILETGIEIHFLHYHSLEEAESKWKRRAERLKSIRDHSRLFFRFCDRDGATDAHFARFEALNFQHKISFSATPKNQPSNRVTKPEENNPNQADDGLTVFWYELENGFNVFDWLNGK